MMSDGWINIEDAVPKHMQEVKVFIANPYFGSHERTGNAVFLWFKDSEEGGFYDCEEQIPLYFVTAWKPIAKQPISEESSTSSPTQA